MAKTSSLMIDEIMRGFVVHKNRWNVKKKKFYPHTPEVRYKSPIANYEKHQELRRQRNRNNP